MTTRRPVAWRRAFTGVGATVVLVACSGAAGSPSISASAVRAPAPAGPNGAVYLTLSNEGDGDDQLVGASTDVAERVEMHQTSMDAGTMSMQQVDAIDVPAGGSAVLETGGFHLMLLDVAQDLAEGDTFDLTLSFASSDDQTVEVEVVSLLGVDGPMGSEHPMGSEGAGAGHGTETMSER